MLKPIDDILSVFRLDTPSGPHWAGTGRWWSGWSLRSFVSRSGDCKTNKMRTELRVTVLQKRDFLEKGELYLYKNKIIIPRWLLLSQTLVYVRFFR